MIFLVKIAVKMTLSQEKVIVCICLSIPIQTETNIHVVSNKCCHYLVRAVWYNISIPWMVEFSDWTKQLELFIVHMTMPQHKHFHSIMPGLISRVFTPSWWIFMWRLRSWNILWFYDSKKLTLHGCVSL